MAVESNRSLQIEVGDQRGLIEVVRQFPEDGKIYSGEISFIANGLRPPEPPDFGWEISGDQMSSYLDRCQEFNILPFSYLTLSGSSSIFYPVANRDIGSVLISRLQTRHPDSGIQLWDQNKKHEFLLRLSKFLVRGGRFGQINYKFTPYGNAPYPGSASFDSFRGLGYLDDTLSMGYEVDELWLNFAKYNGLWNRSDGIPTHHFGGSLRYPAVPNDRTKVDFVVTDKAKEDMRDELLNWYYALTLKKEQY